MRLAGSLFFIGLGDQLLSDLQDREACQSQAENVAEASIGLVTGTAGVILGTIAGVDIGESIGGAGVGALVGGAAGQEIGGVLGRRAGEALNDGEPNRNPDEQFSYQLCQMIAASNVLKTPLIERYLQIASEECSFDPDWVPRMNSRDWELVYLCNNGQSREAREIMLQLIRINKATCYGIEKLHRAIVRGGTTPFRENGSDPFCDDSSPAEVWRSFLGDRMQ